MNFIRADAFTSEWGQGNPACIVLLKSNDSATEEDMKRIAHSMLCEVAFVLNADTWQTSGRIQMRFFTAAKVELKFIGHVTIAALVALAEGRDITTVIECKGGNIPARVVDGTANFEIPAPSDVHDVSVPLDILREAVGPVELDSRVSVPKYIFGTSSRLVVFVEDLSVVKPDLEKIIEVSNFAKVSGLFVVQLAGNGTETHSRMFCPLIGVPEDCCSGNAHGLLGFLLGDLGLLPPENKFVGYQGYSVGRPGVMRIEMIKDVDNICITAVVGGNAAVFSAGLIDI